MGCPKIVPKGNLSEMVSNWQISIGYEDNQIMTGISEIRQSCQCCWSLNRLFGFSFDAILTIDTALYFRGLNEGEETKSKHSDRTS